MEKLEADLTGTRLYSPEMIAAYLVLSGLPIGLFLYGLNMRRRGQAVLGGVMCILSAITLAGLFLAVAAGRPVAAFGAGAALVAIGMFSIESGPYRMALRRGAIRARWWPPAVWLVAIYVLTVILGVALHK
jgi:hypothetical protein